MVLTSALFLLAVQSSPADKILQGAKKQLAKPSLYDASYKKIQYPNGDVSKNKGACTDVVIRAFRNAGFDLQVLIHEDMGRVRYPGQGSGRDKNIDHRRVRNQVNFFKRHGKKLSLSADKASWENWKPGDVVCWKLPGGLDHTGIVSNKKTREGKPFVIHNISLTKEENVLTRWEIVGHYRYPK